MIKRLHFLKCWMVLLVLISLVSSAAFAQAIVGGAMIDAANKEKLSFVNIGIKHKNTGTVSLRDGSFSLLIPAANEKDTLCFSIVGYQELNLPIKNIISSGQKIFGLTMRPTEMNEVKVSAKLVEKKIGLVKNHALIHFTDGSTNQHDIFEIAQLVKMDTGSAKITSVSLTITAARSDSGTFRINFYGFDGRRPTSRIVEKSIVQTQAIAPGLLTFDLKPYHLTIKGSFVIGIEFLPNGKLNNSRIDYEVKLGGPAKSFVRSSSQGDWRVPPHHYRMFITALVRAGTKMQKAEENEEAEARASWRMFSQHVQDSFSVFVRLPKDYKINKHKNYPVVFLLDANAYFDIAGNAITEISNRQSVTEPVLIGIGYKDFLENDSLRNRDYTYPIAPASDSFSVSGGGDRFLQFIRDELIPEVDKKYRTDTASRSIMGHSLGGYFVMYALQRALISKSSSFKNFIAASPSLAYHDYWLVKQFDHISTANEVQKPFELLVTMGEEELKASATDTTGSAKKYTAFIKNLAASKEKMAHVKSKIYPGFSHMETAVSTFEDGLKWMMTGEQ